MATAHTDPVKKFIKTEVAVSAKSLQLAYSKEDPVSPIRTPSPRIKASSPTTLETIIQGKPWVVHTHYQIEPIGSIKEDEKEESI